MGMADDSEKHNVRERMRGLCLDLNVDAETEDDAWDAFDRLSYNYTLEGDSLHWLACCLYVSCRKSQVCTVSGLDEVEGNFVSLTRLLRTTKLSLIEFFKKMMKWVDMASLPLQFRNKVNRLERNFCVSTVTFRKFVPIFRDIFAVNGIDAVSIVSIDQQPKALKGRKQKRTRVNVNEVFVFCWTTFVQVKGKFSSISDDLVNCFHLLLCCVDWIFANVLLSNKTHLLNPAFPGLPKNFVLRDYKTPTKPPCILYELCQHYLGIEIEAKEIKNYYWKTYIKKLFDNKVLVGSGETLMKVLDVDNFDRNNKALNKAYEEYVLNSGDFDEREFIGGNNPEITSPTQPPTHLFSNQTPSSSSNSTPATTNSTLPISLSNQVVPNEVNGLINTFEDRLKTMQKEAFSEHKPLNLHTPLTNRRYLVKKGAIFSPVSTATQSVSCLMSLLSHRNNKPSEQLQAIFNTCEKSAAEKIDKQLRELGEVFCLNYMSKDSHNNNDHTQANNNTSNSERINEQINDNNETTTPTTLSATTINHSTNINQPMDFSKPRLQLAVGLYYLLLEKVVMFEMSNPSIHPSKRASIPATLFEQVELHQTLFAVCLEIVIFSYNSLNKMFPWVIETLNIPAFAFYKVIEIVNRVEKGFSRDVVKHLNRVEESILEVLVWRSGSVLWSVLHKFGDVPSVSEVLLPSQFSGNNLNNNNNINKTTPLSSPTNNILKVMVNLAGSPINRPISETFTSPIPTRRRLFDTPTTTAKPAIPATTATPVVKLQAQARQQLILTTATTSASKTLTRLKVAGRQHIVIATTAATLLKPKPTTTTFIIPPSSIKQPFTTIKPTTTTIKPTTAIIKPTTTTIKPTTIKPNTTTIKPTTAIIKPTTTTFKPASTSMLIFKTSPIATRQTRLSTTTTTPAVATTTEAITTATGHKTRSGVVKSTKTSVVLSPQKRKLSETSSEAPPIKCSATFMSSSNPSFISSIPPPPITTFSSTILSSTSLVSHSNVVPILNNNRAKKTGSVPLFFRKVYTLASTRLRDLCDRLGIDQSHCSKIWTCVEHAFMHHIHLLKDRHIDQVIMCCVYVICKVTEQSQQFHEIMKCYRMQPQAESHVYRSVLLKSRLDTDMQTDMQTSGKPGKKITARDERRLRREKEMEMGTVRSSSSLGRPPTPTKLAGTSSSFQFEERGDLIKFYNSIFIPLVKSFALKFATKNEKNEKIVLSPLPAIRNQNLSPRRVSSNVYVSPIPPRAPNSPPSHTSSHALLYSVNQSLPLELQRLNSLIQQGSKKKGIKNLKNLVDEGGVEEGGMAEGGGMFRQRLQEVVTNWSVNNAA